MGVILRSTGLHNGWGADVPIGPLRLIRPGSHSRGRVQIAPGPGAPTEQRFEIETDTPSQPEVSGRRQDDGLPDIERRKAPLIHPARDPIARRLVQAVARSRTSQTVVATPEIQSVLRSGVIGGRVRVIWFGPR